jgi:hypothetical protein
MKLPRPDVAIRNGRNESVCRSGVRWIVGLKSLDGRRELPLTYGAQFRIHE